MKEIRNIIAVYDQMNWSEEKAALATVVVVEESAYRRIGARMFVKSNGDWIGGISGGCLEGDALKRAQIAILKDQPSIVVYDTMDDDAHQIGVGLGCNGRIEVLFTPIDHTDKNNPVERLKIIQNHREPSIFYQVTSSNSMQHLGAFSNQNEAENFSNKMQISFQDLLSKTKIVQERKKSKVFNFESQEGSSFDILIEFIRPEIQLIIVGDNYDVNAFVGIADELGWDIHVIGLLRKMGKPIVDRSRKTYAYDQVNKIQCDAYTSVVLMSHDYKWDMKMLLHFVNERPAYIGMLGPKKRMIKMQNELNDDGHNVDLNQISHFFSPIGLDIGAETPEEIALSITAEIISHFRGRQGASLKHREGTIHERE